MLEKISMRIHRSFFMGCRYIVIAACTAAVFVGVSGCARHADVSGVRPDIFWPNPPEIKRIAFVKAVSKPEDLNIRPGFLKRVVNYIVGRTAASIVSPYG
ncbi:MAG: hypothetical protein WB792_12475, partial [Desulfobacterales bacterium]